MFQETELERGKGARHELAEDKSSIQRYILVCIMTVSIECAVLSASTLSSEGTAQRSQLDGSDTTSSILDRCNFWRSRFTPLSCYLPESPKCFSIGGDTFYHHQGRLFVGSSC